MVARFLWTLVVLVAVAADLQAMTYQITDLGTLGGTISHAFGVNIHGDVVGESTTATGETRAFLYHSGTIIDLGVLEVGHNFSQAYGINDSGKIVGLSLTRQPNGDGVKARPFVYGGGTMTMVGSLGGDYGVAYDINNVGQIVGISANADGVTHGFLKTSGTMLDVGNFTNTYPYSIAYGINESGIVTGYSSTGANRSEAFVFGSDGSLSHVGDLGGTSQGFAINDGNYVTGASIIDGAGHERAFVWHDGVISNLGVANGAVTSLGSDINNLGDVVGTLVFDPNDGNLNHGFLYHNGAMIDVNTLLPSNSGWILRDAQAISDHEHIVGFGIHNGEEHAYLLAPFPGDFDRNGIVDARDYVTWAHGYGSVVAPCSGGDSNCNGFVERSDYGPWRANFGEVVGVDLASTAAVVAVPEPSSLLWMVMLLAVMRFRKCGRLNVQPEM